MKRRREYKGMEETGKEPSVYERYGNYMVRKGRKGVDKREKEERKGKLSGEKAK